MARAIVARQSAVLSVPIAVSLPNNAATTVINVSTYVNGIGMLIAGVSIVATTSVKFYASAQFSKNAAGTDWNLSYQTSGQTPPVGFSITITTAGIIQIVMPSVAGYVSATIQ